MSAQRHADHLPRPRRRRWQPLRGGLLNLYRFDEEEFWFEDGRLLLRGNNGTGKSRVLALQLPFLLDGEVAPHRLEPDGDPAKRIEWNLLLGEHQERTGYTWLELGRRGRDEEAADEQVAGEDPPPPDGESFLTLGCGLRAVAGRGRVERWFFVTPRRIGRGLTLRGAHGEALSRTRLAEALEGEGEIFTSASDYRRTVDHRLFRLGKGRYEALINLLIQLRRPQLSRKLDEKNLSSIFSEALPPLDRAVLADVAESFRGLEADRDALATLRSAADGVEGFLRGYRLYAQIATRRRAAEVRRSHSGYEHAQRRLRQAERRSRQAAETLAALEEERRALGLEEAAASREAQVLRQTPELRDHRALEDARRQVSASGQEAERAAAEEERAAAERRSAAVERRSALAAAEEAETEVAGRLAETTTLAEAIGLGGRHRRRIAELPLPELETETVAALQPRLEELADERRRAVAHLHGLGAELEEARRELARAKEAQTERQSDLDHEVEGQKQAEATARRALEALLGAYGEWHHGLRELRLPSAGELEPAVREWAETLEGDSPIRAARDRAMAEAADRFAAEQAALEAGVEAGEAELAELAAERDRLAAGALQPPPAPPTRDPEARSERPGAPLWHVCDFAPELDGEARAGLEAALEGAGLLDAWLTPDGGLLDPGDLDTVLVAAGSAPASRGLDHALRPAGLAGAGMPEAEAVQAVLGAIGLGEGEGEVWVAADGRFRLGPLHGGWAKPAPQHIGEEAREAERRRRLQEISTLQAAAEERLDQHFARLADLRERRKTAQREAAAAPGEDELRHSAAARAAADRLIEQARSRLVAAEALTRKRRELRDRAAERRDEEARDLGLFEQRDELEAVGEAVEAYRHCLAGLWPRLHGLIDRRRDAAASTGRDEAAASRLQELERRKAELESQLHAARAEFEALERALDPATDDLLTRLAAAEARAAEAAGRREEIVARREEHVAEQARAEQKIETERRDLDDRIAARAAAIERLSELLAAGLVEIALPPDDRPRDEPEGESELSVRRAVAIARQLEGTLTRLEVDADDDAWQRQSNRVHALFQELGSVLSADGYQPDFAIEHGLFVVTVPFQGRRETMATFQGALLGEIEARNRVLAEQERTVIENHLIGEVSLHLQQRLREAEELVIGINQQIESRPTSTGMTLRFRWQPLDEELRGLSDARRLLMAEPATWSPDDREALGGFLHDLVRQPEEAQGGLQEHLTRVLDYRTWHRFSVERRQQGQWRRLTRRTHGTGSGGEKAIALTLPQFAAAAAYYDTAQDSRAPRLILLDEAFVGVDPDMRSKCMGLLKDFDLDFVMTSELEWGCYPALPGLAIYQLATRPEIDAVGVSRWLWNGRERRLAPHPSPARVAVAAAAEGSPGRLFEEPP